MGGRGGAKKEKGPTWLSWACVYHPGQTSERREERKYQHVFHRQKGKNTVIIFSHKTDGLMDRWMDGLTDGWKAIYMNTDGETLIFPQ